MPVTLRPRPAKNRAFSPGAAAGVEDRAGDLVGHVEERLLRPADVPGRLAGVDVLEGVAVGYGGHGRSPVVVSWFLNLLASRLVQVAVQPVGNRILR